MDSDSDSDDDILVDLLNDEEERDEVWLNMREPRILIERGNVVLRLSEKDFFGIFRFTKNGHHQIL